MDAMLGNVDLVALKPVPVSSGTIPAGTEFRATAAEAQAYVAAGVAIERARHIAAGWDGLRWADCSVAILASGPSLSEEQCAAVHAWRMADLARHKVIAINTTFRRAPWADVVYACDWQWWEVYHKEVSDLCSGQFWTQAEESNKRFGVRLIKSRKGQGLSLVQGTIHQGSNSGYQAIGLSHQAGSRQIYLLGYDMSGCHWHGPHPGHLKKENRYADWLVYFQKLAVDCKSHGVNVVNCTQRTSLRSFPMQDWREAFK
jgi:hypothetical protein